MNSTEKIAAVDKLISLALKSVQDSKAETEEWEKEYAFVDRITSALLERTQLLSDSANRLRLIKEEVEVGKL